MKKTITTILATLISQAAFAGDFYCGTNVEQVPGSQVYNKLVFWEKIDTAKPTTHFLLKDGTLLRQQDFTPDTLSKVTNGALAMGITFSQSGKPQVSLSKVRRNKANEITYVNTTIAVSESTYVLMIANHAAIMCKEM